MPPRHYSLHSDDQIVDAKSGPNIGNVRMLRPRHSISTAEDTKSIRDSRRKRVWTASSFAEENHSDQTKRSKKIKVEAIAAKKVLIEAGRRRFFSHHESVFKPFNSIFLHKLSVEPEIAIKNVYYARDETQKQPSLIMGGQMKDYQLHGLSFLVWMHENGMNSILGDEMGLGKTLQTLSLFAYIKEKETVAPETHLVICPLSVLSNWMNESARWLPSFKVFRFHGPLEERVRLKEELKWCKFDLVITTYEAYAAEDSWFKTRRWSYCVLDEGHRIKSSTTNLSHKVQGLGSQYRLILTGTPVQNNLLELWSLLHWLYPSVFTSATERNFLEAFNLSLGKYNASFLDAVHKLLQLIMLRRTKQTVEFSVPPLEEMVIFLPLTEVQRFWYMRLLKRLDTVSLDEIFMCKSDEVNDGRKEAQVLVARAMTQSTGPASKKYRQLMNLLMQLRRVCDHPYTVEGSFPEPYSVGEHIVASSSKLQFIDKLLRELLPKGERVLIFSQWTGMLDMIEDYMFLRGIPYARLDGSVPRARRTLDIRLFQQEKSPYQVFLVSTQAGGLGINLTKASHVVMVDSHWNPAVDHQAIARSHRIGQTKEVKVYRLICQNSVEDQMLDRIRKKLFLSLKVMSGKDGEMDSALKTHEIMQILHKGTSALARWEVDSADKGLSAFLSASIDDILARSKRTEDLRDFRLKCEAGEAVQDKKLAIDLQEEERKLLTGIAQVHTRYFEGELHQKDDQALEREWTAMQKRARVDRLVIVNGVESLPFSSTPSTQAQPTKRRKVAWDHEDFCVQCHDGGALLCCADCPRVFHPACLGLSKNTHKLRRVRCTQHVCVNCGRKPADAGGMLFRCRTCSSAQCEDCMPKGDIAAIGPTLPELVLLGYGEVSQAYWVHCQECILKFDTDEQWKRTWELMDIMLKTRLAAVNKS